LGPPVVVFITEPTHAHTHTPTDMWVVAAVVWEAMR
jgi:hypothetical protein